MTLRDWYEKAFKQTKQPVKICPTCGSTNYGYITRLVNFEDVVNNGCAPMFTKRFLCYDCGHEYVEPDATE